MSAIVRDLKQDVIRLNCKLKLSNFLPYHIEDIIKERVPDENYVLGVTYCQGDSQICMSGHIKQGETYEEGCVREMSEELFLEPRNFSDVREVKVHHVNHFFIFKMSDTKIKPRETFEDIEDTHERAVIIVHGSEYDILRYMKKLKVQGYSNDGIVSIWAARKKNILGAIYGVRKNRKGVNYVY